MNAGLRRIVDILRETDSTNKIDAMTRLVSCAGEILRLLANIVAPFRKDASLPQVDPSVQDHLFAALCAKIAEMTEMMAALVQQPWSEDIARGSQAVIFLARLLQFYLGFPNQWSQQAKDLSEKLCANLTRLALVRMRRMQCSCDGF